MRHILTLVLCLLLYGTETLLALSAPLTVAGIAVGLVYGYWAIAGLGVLLFLLSFAVMLVFGLALELARER